LNNKKEGIKMEFIHSNYANSLTKQVETTETDDDRIATAVDMHQAYITAKDMLPKIVEISAQRNDTNDITSAMKAFFNITDVISNYNLQQEKVLDELRNMFELNPSSSDNKKEKESEKDSSIEVATVCKDNDIVVESKPIETVPAPVVDPIIPAPIPKKEEEFKLDNKKMWDIVYPTEGDNSDDKFDIINLNKVIGLSYHEGLCTIYTMGSTVARACTYKEYQDFAKSVNYVIKGDADYLNYTFENYYAGESDTIKCEYYFIFDEVIYASDIRYDNSATIQLGPHIITIPNIEVPDDELSEYDLFRNRIKFYWRARLGQNQSGK
jgi:hypothetical protein